MLHRGLPEDSHNEIKKRLKSFGTASFKLQNVAGIKTTLPLSFSTFCCLFKTNIAPRISHKTVHLTNFRFKNNTANYNSLFSLMAIFIPVFCPWWQYSSLSFVPDGNIRPCYPRLCAAAAVLPPASTAAGNCWPLSFSSPSTSSPSPPFRPPPTDASRRTRAKSTTLSPPSC